MFQPGQRFLKWISHWVGCGPYLPWHLYNLAVCPKTHKGFSFWNISFLFPSIHLTELLSCLHAEHIGRLTQIHTCCTSLWNSSVSDRPGWYHWNNLSFSLDFALGSKLWNLNWEFGTVCECLIELPIVNQSVVSVVRERGRATEWTGFTLPLSLNPLEPCGISTFQRSEMRKHTVYSLTGWRHCAQVHQQDPGL